ncbi:hypothetical protein [Elizabethkingia anophelis]
MDFSDFEFNNLKLYYIDFTILLPSEY